MKRFIDYYKYLLALIIGHLTVFKHLFKRPVTLQYPEKRAKLSDKFRGEHALSAGKCTMCGTCQRVCPSFGTIDIVKDTNEEGKPYLVNYSIDYNKCIFCGNCVQYCPFNAIKMIRKYELANEKKSALKIEINTLKSNYIEHIINKREDE